MPNCPKCHTALNKGNIQKVKHGKRSVSEHRKCPASVCAISQTDKSSTCAKKQTDNFAGSKCLSTEVKRMHLEFEATQLHSTPLKGEAKTNEANTLKTNEANRLGPNAANRITQAYEQANKSLFARLESIANGTAKGGVPEPVPRFFISKEEFERINKLADSYRFRMILYCDLIPDPTFPDREPEGFVGKYEIFIKEVA